MRRILSFLFLLTTLLADAQDLSKFYHGLEFRNIGPSRGGRSVASCGIGDDPLTYYMGSTGGGLWKTTDAGVSWKNISDDYFKMGSVGSVEVAPSDPNVIYVGMGEHPVRGVMTSHGDGMYKSTDAGKTWKHIGLHLSRHIAEIRIHPDDPDIVYVAVQGAQHGPSSDRGIYRSVNGGNSWKKIFYIDQNTGCADLSMDVHNPRILYAGMWDHRRLPWQVRSGGPGSGLYKSTDGGTTWEQLKKGLPEGMGKVAIDVSAANSEVVYANIEAEGEKGGVYRSNDAGKSWKQTTKDRITIARSWYYIEIFADPKDENKVYVLNAPMLKSIDGGKTFNTIKNPHGDQHHLWINPNNTENIILSNDGGACVTFNGGKTWSSQQNQVTMQFYRVITDEQIPYYIYAGQQDNSSIAAASRTNGGSLGWKDWYPVAGCESAFLAFNPKDPQLVYGGCYQGNISLFDHKTRESRDIMAYPTAVLGWHPKDMKYRFNWNAPIVANPFDPSIIYHTGNKVLKTTDEGSSWTEISPDLTRNDTTKHVDGGIPYTIEGAGGEVYNTISYLAYSPHENGTMYTGSDCGKVYITQNEGEDWKDITPKGLPESLINAIDISAHHPGTAYISVTRYKFNDMRPMIYKTTNYGQSWTKIISGIPNDVFVRVVREDPKVADLLYAGTENGLYTSFDGGKKWQSLQLNLPTCPITDFTFADNDMVVATSGRSFWILDDLSAIQASSGKISNNIKLYTPKPAYDLPSGSYRTGGMGENHKGGVYIDYQLPMDIDTGELILEIYNSSGAKVRDWSSKKAKSFKKYVGAPKPEKTLKSKKGVNRINWNLSKEQLPYINEVFMLGSFGGYSVSPGEYKAVLKYGNSKSEAIIKILKDPRLDINAQAYAERETFVDEIVSTFEDVTSSVNSFISVKKQLEQRQSLIKKNKTAGDLFTTGKALLERMSQWEGKLIQRDQKTFQDVINFPNRLNAELINLASRASSHDPRLTAGMKKRKATLLSEWNTHRTEMEAIITEPITDYSRGYKKLGLPILILEK
ncbi:MAG: glycosyl hydrolase [Saprospiraceae bacterium]